MHRFTRDSTENCAQIGTHKTGSSPTWGSQKGRKLAEGRKQYWNDDKSEKFLQINLSFNFEGKYIDGESFNVPTDFCILVQKTTLPWHQKQNGAGVYWTLFPRRIFSDFVTEIFRLESSLVTSQEVFAVWTLVGHTVQWIDATGYACTGPKSEKRKILKFET